MANGYVNFSDFFDMNAESAAADAVTDSEAAAQQSAADAAALQNVQAQFEADSRAGGTKQLTDYSAFLELEAEAKRRDEYARSQQRSVYDNALGADPGNANPLRDSLGTARAQAAARQQKEAGYRQASQAAADQRAKDKARRESDFAGGASNLDAQRRRISREAELREQRNKFYETQHKAGSWTGVQRRWWEPETGRSYDALRDTLETAGAWEGDEADHYKNYLSGLSTEDQSILTAADAADAEKRRKRGY